MWAGVGAWGEWAWLLGKGRSMGPGSPLGPAPSEEVGRRRFLSDSAHLGEPEECGVKFALDPPSHPAARGRGGQVLR